MENEVTKKKTKASKAKKQQQTKIPGTGRLDAIAELEEQAEVYTEKRDARMSMQVEEEAEQEKLTELLEKHKLAEYFYEDSEGQPRRAYIPEKAKAKVQKVKKKAPASDAE